MIRLIVAGAVAWTNVEAIRRELAKLPVGATVIHGDSPGADALAPRVEELAPRSTEGALTPEEQREYAEIVRLNDRLGLLKLEAEDIWTMRAPS
ncbi:hypothetical protein WME79_09980 [Sorangium sp. So ce726]|uniref:hypothetical protein n=1 Tax=Sorangium sp. So ce726 TaxID=3133319 RepID=UPI003F5E4520